MYDAGVQQIAHRVVRQHNVNHVIHVLSEREDARRWCATICTPCCASTQSESRDSSDLRALRAKRCTTLVCNKLHTVLCFNTT